jgi:uncharacterized protein (TIGR01370 family)
MPEGAAAQNDGGAASTGGAPAASMTVEPPAGEAGTEIPPVAAGVQPAEGPCPRIADRSRAMRLRGALADGFGVQYWGERYTAEELAEQPHGVLIIEGAKIGAPYSESGREVFFTPDEIAAISHGGERPVLGYLNIGEIETYRDYWIDLAAGRNAGGTSALPRWVGPHAGHGEYLSAYWVPEWRDVLLARVDRLMALGVGGLFLDDVLHYYSHATDKALQWPESGRPEGPHDAPGLARAMMELVIAVADRVREWDCDALVVVNNAVFIGRDADEAAQGDGTRPVFEAYLAAIDAILVENALSPAAHPNIRIALDEDFVASGLSVLTLDVLSQHDAPDELPEDLGALRQRKAEAARDAGFFPYLVENGGFNRLWPPIARPKG